MKKQERSQYLGPTNNQIPPPLGRPPTQPPLPPGTRLPVPPFPIGYPPPLGYRPPPPQVIRNNVTPIETMETKSRPDSKRTTEETDKKSVSGGQKKQEEEEERNCTIRKVPAGDKGSGTGGKVKMSFGGLGKRSAVGSGIAIKMKPQVLIYLEVPTNSNGIILEGMLSCTLTQLHPT